MAVADGYFGEWFGESGEGEMSEQKKPVGGEWWMDGSDPVFIVGLDSRGHVAYQRDGDRIYTAGMDYFVKHFTHEPRCTSFDWTPPAVPEETFPQWWNTTDERWYAFLRRDSADSCTLVDRSGNEIGGFGWRKDTEENRTRLTEAEALERLDWVDITDPDHVLREGADWVCYDGKWEKVDVLAGTLVRYKLPSVKFRCLRKHLPPTPEPPAESQGSPFKTASDNPHGLHQKYIITKTNGKPVNPDAVYFVLRLDGDHVHANACRSAGIAWANTLLKQHDAESVKLHQTANELVQMISKLTAKTIPAGIDTPPAESSDDWVTQDLCVARPDIDQLRYCYKSGRPGQWWTCCQEDADERQMNGSVCESDGSVIELRCRRRDLPVVEVPEQPQTTRQPVRLWRPKMVDDNDIVHVVFVTREQEPDDTAGVVEIKWGDGQFYVEVPAEK